MAENKPTTECIKVAIFLNPDELAHIISAVETVGNRGLARCIRLAAGGA